MLYRLPGQAGTIDAWCCAEVSGALQSFNLHFTPDYVVPSSHGFQCLDFLRVLLSLNMDLSSNMVLSESTWDPALVYGLLLSGWQADTVLKHVQFPFPLVCGLPMVAPDACQH